MQAVIADCTVLRDGSTARSIDQKPTEQAANFTNLQIQPTSEIKARPTSKVNVSSPSGNQTQDFCMPVFRSTDWAPPGATFTWRLNVNIDMNALKIKTRQDYFQITRFYRSLYYIIVGS